MCDNTIKIGQYIVIQKQNYKKLHKYNKPNSTISIGKDTLNLSGIIGCKFFSTFKMLSKGTKRKKEFDLQLTDEAINLIEEIGLTSSGADNRNIYDDGRSQKLSATEISELKSDSTSASDIVETLITNSNTFHSKTEFSQEKYLKKKEKKYCEYVQILRPNLRMISEILYKLDSTKVQGIRIDTLSQIVTMSNISCEGNHLLYDSGSNGLLAAALLSAMGSEDKGKLIHMHPGNMSQKQALLAMNFEPEQLGKCLSVNVYSVLRQIYQGCDTHTYDTVVESQGCDTHTHDTVVESQGCDTHTQDIEVENQGCDTQTLDTVGETESNLKRKASESMQHNSKIPKLNDSQNINNDIIEDKNIEGKEVNQKKPKWHFDNIAASEVLSNKVDSLVIASKEDPQNIFLELVRFVKPGRPFVIYYSVAEPLQNLYMTLKCTNNVAALRLTCNWLRNYQILPERTHPDVMMNTSSGFLLTGYVLK